MSGVLKFIAPLVQPIGFAWLMLVLGTLVCLKRRRPLGASVCGCSAILLWLLAQPIITTPLLGQLERRWLNHTLATAPPADAAIVLGGGWRTSRSDFAALDLTPLGDRLLAGFELCRSGRVPVLVVGGDAARPMPGIPPASDQVRWWLQQWNLSSAEVLTLGPVRTTRDEAERARELVSRRGWKKILLVTSAFHMSRSMAAFERAGVPVHPVACDFQIERFGAAVDGSGSPVGSLGFGGWNAFPDEEAFMTFALWWHEQLGGLAYRVLSRL